MHTTAGFSDWVDRGIAGRQGSKWVVQADNRTKAVPEVVYVILPKSLKNSGEDVITLPFWVDKISVITAVKAQYLFWGVAVNSLGQIYIIVSRTYQHSKKY